MMGPLLWTLYFIYGQGYTVDSNIMFQDNHITMHMMLNGKKSSLKNTKYINLRYLFVNGVIKRGKMSVGYCPTEEMWSEVLSNSLQVKSYRIMRIKLIDIPKIYIDLDDNSPSKGRKVTGVSSKEKQV